MSIMSKIFSKNPVKIIEIPLMTAGLCGYGDKGNIYISDETMYKIMPSLLGISVIIGHDGSEAVGEVVEVFQNPNDTDQWMGKLSIRDPEAISLLSDGYGVSTAYRIINETNIAGKWNNINYESEVLGVEWLHVAIVDNPRYTIAKDGVFLNSVKKTEGQQMFNLFRVKREKVLLNEDEKLLVKIGDEELELNEIIKVVSEEEKKNKKNFASDDMEVEINGEKICVKELIDRYNACIKNETKEEKEADEKIEEDFEKLEEAKEEEKEEEKDDKEEIKNEDKEDEKENEDKEDKEDKKENEDKEDEKENEDKEDEKEIKENEAEIKAEEIKKEEDIKNSLDVKLSYLDRGMNVELNQYKTLSERMALANKKYGSSL